KSASLLLGRREVHDPVHIHIQKRIPVGAGLGGGSSDAAATMLGLNRFLRLGWDKSSMIPMAATLGADVPFFVHGRVVRARGIGDQLKPLSFFPRLWMVILYPGFPVSTRWVYKNLDLKLTKLNKNTSLKVHFQGPEELVPILVNDLEGVTIRRYPQIAFLKERLIQEGALGALMSGSGSSVFGIFAAEKGARRAFRRLREEEGVRAYLVRSLT
ncbi:MAG: 4-(cytidine 5'-diphospho)-2-C-methyl-D-erythritol kinase, partial [Deltaproteobacteria bacterium]|nr:4-(cytidine 5'-diphospho)-2-C-methyl-D-erythritol kinase [Deltaproteobacteria bacterium]